MDYRQEEILKGLNEDQLEAAINYLGPSIVLAGPGAGDSVDK